MRIEMSVVLNGDIFDFGVSVEYTENFKVAKIAEEFLKVNGRPVYSRKGADVNLANGPTFLIDWHVVAFVSAERRRQRRTHW